MYMIYVKTLRYVQGVGEEARWIGNVGRGWAVNKLVALKLHPSIAGENNKRNTVLLRTVGSGFRAKVTPNPRQEAGSGIQDSPILRQNACQCIFETVGRNSR